MELDINKLKFDKNGLIPAIIQDFETKQILTLAYMNKESLNIHWKKKEHVFGAEAATVYGEKAKHLAMSKIS